jgi:Tol biopolymer transport system component
VFVHDRVTHATTLASVATNGTQAEFGAWNGEISANGGHVVFTTDTGLATGDDNETDDVYIRNLGLGQTRRVSVMLAGGDLGAVSADGRYVAFSGGDGNVYLRDTVALTTRRVNANTTAPGFFPAISGDGRWVAFLSPGNASGTDANGVRWDVFLRDTVANVTTVGSTKLFLEQIDADSWNPALSQDGRYVGWISAGRFVDDDTNGLNDVFVRAVPVPKITSVTPATVTRGTNPTLTVSGTGFIAPIVAAVNLGNDGVSVTNVTVVNGTTLTLNLSVASNAKLGKQDVDVLNAGTGMGLFQGGGARCGGCLTVK